MAPQQRPACPSTQVVQHRLLRRTLRLRALVLVLVPLVLVPLVVPLPMLPLLLAMLLRLELKPTPQHSQMMLKLAPAR